MKKRAIRSLAINKNTISKFNHLNNIKGGNGSETSCLCGPSQCDCLADGSF